ncbi:MAG: trigger factor [Candidatus Beckwithbacteria bacterium]|nr:trigger factor [Candidatus Beckwithbacteria bacterium]
MPLDSKLTWLPQKTFELEFSLPWKQVKITYDLVLKELVKATDLKGFRKGKAPRELIEKQADKGKIYGEVINQLLPVSYAAAVKQHQLKPALAPKITIVSAEEDKPWQFKAKSCELPEVKLGNYQGSARSALVKSQLEKKDLTQSQKFNFIAQALIKDNQLELPDLLIESERDRLLSKLLAELQKLDLSLEQYAGSNQKTVEQVKDEYKQTGSNTLKLELILQAIANDRKITIKEAEIDKMISQSGDEKLKKQLNTPSERAYIAGVLRKKHAIDFLTSLG